MHGRGVCGRGCAWQGGHAWQGACMAEGVAEGVYGRGCMRGRGCVAGGHVWQERVCMAGGMCCRGACMAGGMHGMHAPQILRDMVNERAVRILLECILVTNVFTIFMPD